MNHRIGAETLPMAGAAAALGTRAWRFDSFEFDLRRGELHRHPDGAAIALRPKAESLLRQFLAQPGRLISREELIAALWPAAVVTDDSLVQCVGELRSALDDTSQRLIRTVPRRGYRWEVAVAPVMDVPETAAQMYAAAPEATGLVAEPVQAGPKHGFAGLAPPTRRPSRRRHFLALGGLGLAAALAVTAALTYGPASAPMRIDEQIAARNTVAVMPFVVAAEDRELRHAADAVADEISAQLSTRVGMRGIGRAATTAPDGSALPVSRIASSLKATHVVSGRVARSGEGQRMAIDVQLSSVADGAVIWAKRFEGTAPSGVGMAPDIGQQVVNAMRNRGGKSGVVPSVAPNAKLDAVDRTLLGWRELDGRKSLADVLRARARFEAALREDPDSIIALHGLAASYGAQRMDPMSRLTAEQVTELERIVDRIRKLDPEGSTGLMMWGTMQMLRGRADLALPAVERASLLVPSYPYGHVLVGQALLLLGRTAEVQAKTERAVELAAGDPRRASAAFLLAAEAALMLGDKDRAYDLAGRSIAAQPSNARAHATLAAIDALSGRPAQATTGMANFLQLWPTATVARYDEYPSGNATYLAQRAQLIEGLRKAGLVEQ